MADSKDSQRWDVFFYVQHLLGMGHLQRAATLAEALHRAGLRVRLVSGGLPVDQIAIRGPEVIQLPPIRATDATFTLTNEAGTPIDDDFKARRRDLLLKLFKETNPRLLLIELFPFGRRQMRFELLPLLEFAGSMPQRPAIVSSLRDILNAHNKPEKIRWMLDTFKRHFDSAIVHGDPDFLPLEESFAEASEIASHLQYSGYIVRPPTNEEMAGSTTGRGEILVSIGGGAVGLNLVEAALEARVLTSHVKSRWRFLLGPNMPEHDFDRIVRNAKVIEENEDGGSIIVERARPDFPLLLRNCRLSISQGGYNTVMEILARKTPAIIVPFAAGGETEQTFRSRKLAEMGYLELLEEDQLSAVNLAAAIDREIAKDKGTNPSTLNLDLEGGGKTAYILKEQINRVADGRLGQP